MKGFPPPYTRARLVLTLTALCLMAFSPRIAAAQGAPQEAGGWFSQDYLTGSWGGLRPDLANQGVALEAAYTFDAFANARGGVARGNAFMHNVDLTLDIDANELMGLSGASFFAYVLGNYGDALSEYVGDAQGVSNIEAPGAWTLYEAWFQQAFLDDAVSFRVGLYDLNSEFAASDVAGLYLGSSHGIGPDMSQSGLNGPSIFPSTGLAARLQVAPTGMFYMQAALVEAVPGTSGIPNTPRVALGRNEGWLIASEVGVTPGAGKVGVGYWQYTEPFETLGDGGRATGYGVYAVGERVLIEASERRPRGLAVYGRIGWASPEVHTIGLAWAAGLVVEAPLALRPDDQIGVAVASAHQSQTQLQLHRATDDPTERSEVALELTYSAPILPGLTIQPNVQYVHNPGMAPALGDAIVLGARLGVAF